ncbi:MAG: hypothetical protein DRJ51_08005 [Thermoprotei archaeon]|nr:MAG: hypothetical protein DRJ51_08005 [Thermoprotei archaeon]
MRLEIIGLKLPEVTQEIDLLDAIVSAAEKQAGGLRRDDVLVITSKIISKARGYIFSIKELEEKASGRAKRLAKYTRKPVWLVEGILRVSRRIVAAIPLTSIVDVEEFAEKYGAKRENVLELLEKDPCVLVTAMPDGRLATDAGIDSSNVPPGFACYPPLDPDKEARRIALEIRKRTGKDVAVIIVDTEASLTKIGSVDVAIGCSGIDPVDRCFGELDLYGKPKYGGIDLVADEIACAAALLIKQAAQGVPVVVIRGLKYKKTYSVGVKDIYIPRKTLRKGILKTFLATAKLKLLRLI